MSKTQSVWPAAFLACTLPGAAFAHHDLDRYDTGIFVQEPQTVHCTLEDGSSAQCHQLVVTYLPEGLEIGPFCPATLDGVGGIWDWDGEEPGLYSLDATFWQMLDAQGYTFFDPNGTVHIVDIATEQPAVDHACINVSADEDVTITMLIPVTPVMADVPTPLGTVAKVGVGLNGVPIFADAPSVLQTGHLPALDTCGGHVDPGGWYHWHATASDIDTVFATEGVEADCASVTQDASAQFGYAFDGFAIYGSLEADGSVPVGLDACGGHVGLTAQDEEVYHYHAVDELPNLPVCLVGVQAQDNFSTTASAGIGAETAGPGGRNEPPRPGNQGGDQDGGQGMRPVGFGGLPRGFDQAAASLGVSVEELADAMAQAGGPPRGPKRCGARAIRQRRGAAGSPSTPSRWRSQTGAPLITTRQ